MVLDGGILSREQYSFLPGIHWFSVLIFLSVLLAYVATDRGINIFLWAIPIAIVYYSLHEAIFNAFFLGYHGFQNPSGSTPIWQMEIGLVFLVTFAFLAIASKYRDRFLRADKMKIAIAMWALLALLFIVRITQGFPVTINIYDYAALPSTVNDPVASAYELVTNVLFAPAFYFTFTIRLRGRGRNNNNNKSQK